jgi:hypothetical protein
LKSLNFRASPTIVLQSRLDGDALLARPSIELTNVEPQAIREAESRTTGCKHWRPEDAEIPFDWILADVLDKRPL